jgi:hypothetical protein
LHCLSTFGGLGAIGFVGHFLFTIGFIFRFKKTGASCLGWPRLP